MNKRIFICIAIILSSFVCRAQGERLDTLYYDSDWNVISNKIFADYYRIALYPEKEIGKRIFRDFYMDGTLFAKGTFISLDSENDKNSIFDKTVERFQKNGKPLSIVNYANGILEGEAIEFAEDGQIKTVKNYNNGKLDGSVIEFNSDGTYTQVLYKNGQYANPYYEYGSPNGTTIKLNLADGSVFWESPSLSEKKNIYRDGTLWEVYSKNGITIGQNLSFSKLYGSWYKIELIISNDSTEPIVFEPVKDVASFTLDKDYKPSALEVISNDQYIKKIKRAQSWEALAVGLSESMSAAKVGYSSTTSTTVDSAHEYERAYGSASANGSVGYGSASFYGTSTSSAYGNSTTTTTSYNGTAAYLADIVFKERLARFDEAQWAERNALEQGYLKNNTIKVGDTISGYILIPKGNGACLIYSINIGDAEYKYSWFINDDFKQKYDETTNYMEIYANEQMDEIEHLIDQNKTTKASSMLRDLLARSSKSRACSKETSDRLQSLKEVVETQERKKYMDPLYN